MKKGQIKMGENLAVLLLFIILLVLGIIFYVQYKRTTMKDELREEQLKHAIETVQRINYLPEVQCSEYGIQRENCYDLSKITAAKKIFQSDQNFYYSILGYSTIEIEPIYPESASIKNIVLYDNKKPNPSMQEIVQTPLALYVPSEDRYIFGVLKVTVYG